MKIEKIINRWRVKAGYIGAVLVLILAKPSLFSLLIGILFSIFGLLIRTWSSGHLNKEKKLATGGPYQYTRNPLYLGNLILGISIVLGCRSWWVFGIFIVYFLFFYPATIKREKERMMKFFQSEYKNYEKNVPLFFPSFKKSYPPNNSSFNWALYKKNKEYRALIGAMLFWLAMTARMIIFH